MHLKPYLNLLRFLANIFFLIFEKNICIISSMKHMLISREKKSAKQATKLNLQIFLY